LKYSHFTLTLFYNLLFCGFITFSINCTPPKHCSGMLILPNTFFKSVPVCITWKINWNIIPVHLLHLWQVYPFW
jgi:hypothetical protein